MGKAHIEELREALLEDLHELQMFVLSVFEFDFITSTSNEVFGPFEDLPLMVGDDDVCYPEEELSDAIIRYRLDKGIDDASKVDWMYAPPVLEALKQRLDEYVNDCGTVSAYRTMYRTLSQIATTQRYLSYLVDERRAKEIKKWCFEIAKLSEEDL